MSTCLGKKRAAKTALSDDFVTNISIQTFIVTDDSHYIDYPLPLPAPQQQQLLQSNHEDPVEEAVDEYECEISIATSNKLFDEDKAQIILSPNSSKHFYENMYSDSELPPPPPPPPDESALSQKEISIRLPEETIEAAKANMSNSEVPNALISCLDELQNCGNLISWKIAGHGKNLTVKVTWNNKHSNNRRTKSLIHSKAKRRRPKLTRKPSRQSLTPRGI